MTSCYDFNNFYLALQQSALFYSNVALRQKQVGYQYPLPLNSFIGTALQTQKPQPVQQQPIKLRKLRGSSASNKKIACPVPIRPQPQQLIRPPPVMISTEENYSMEVNYSQDINNTLNSSKRKVNFAQPLFTVKIKSPTPLHSRDYGGTGGGVWGVPRTGMNVIETESESSADQNETLAATSASTLEGNGNLAYTDFLEEDVSAIMVEEDSGSGCLKNKRKKKRKSKKRLFADLGGGGDDQGFDDLDLEAYENRVNEDDYEFISEIRLCTKEDMEKSSKRGTSNHDAKAEEMKRQMELERKKEMEALYGVVGAGRIIRMEDRVEETFEKELRRIK